MNPVPTRRRTPARFATVMSLGLLWLLPAAQAHHVWIEHDAKEARLIFGEFGDDLREASPGLLDKFVKPTAARIGARGVEPLAVTKTTGAFVIAGRAGPGESLVAEEAAYPSFERKDGDKVLRGIDVPAARMTASTARQAGHLTLDLVLTGVDGADGLQLQALHKGQPLAKAKVALVTPSGWMQEHRRDADGHIRVGLPWRGTYVLQLSHEDKTPGEWAGGERFDSARYVTSLTLVRGKGLAPLPAAPAATPNK